MAVGALPRHVGIIMDGNGRWAKSRGLPRSQGHREGLEVAKRIVAHASNRGITHLSLYTFSTENWKRAEDEVSFLMGLIKTHLRKQYDFYRQNGIRILHSGDLSRLPDAVQKEILLAEEDTKSFTGLKVNLLLNYGGRDEIIRAVRRCLDSGIRTDEWSEEVVKSNLDHPDFPDLDLIVRTSGEMRLSNFLLWQSAYAEFYFSDEYWPDWTERHFDDALSYYESRNRRFGGAEE